MKKFSMQAVSPSHPYWEEFCRREIPIYEREDEIRSPFARDYTRILHSLAYRRLKHKTQLFFNAAKNDHICTRIEHVQHVESVSHTIAMALGLNEELTRAIAIAHDLGHAPFGHEGERVLKVLTEKYLGKTFWHEQNGVYFVDHVELLEDNECCKRNLNLTYAVRDGIISHCGEVDENGLKPREERFSLEQFTKAGEYQASTWEGCVVKISDKIAYLGRDLEDADRLGYLSAKQKEQLLDMARVWNQKAMNTTVIMHNMIIDLCENSSPEAGLLLSPMMAKQMDSIKEFNYENICRHKRLEPLKGYTKLVLEQLFETLKDGYQGNLTDTIRCLTSEPYQRYDFAGTFVKWLVQYCDSDFAEIPWAQELTANCRNHKIYGCLETEKQYLQAVIDFIAGMTDVYAVHSFEELLRC